VVDVVHLATGWLALRSLKGPVFQNNDGSMVGGLFPMLEAQSALNIEECFYPWYQ
jgi:hypothetical protein